MIDSTVGGVESWLSLREASRRMGVSPATLRGWADEGRVESYRTPGGHRRFRVGESGAVFKKEKRGAAARWRLLEHSAVGRIQLAEEVGETKLASPQARSQKRELERELIQLCTLSLRQEQTNLQARVAALGQAFAKWTWRYRIALRDTITTLGTLRIALLESVVEIAFALSEPNVDELNLWLRRVNEIVDGVSLAMLEFGSEHEQQSTRK
ncbi:MAG: MerR family DNA-binding transcriptional regulator [Chloroflexota bacterium]|nr:MAG: MerR family DNA-binding transcriptional regulator [Chloroflexota bacterium]